MGELNTRTIREWVHLLLTVSTALFVVSGLGISDYQLIGTITLGLLNKGVSQRIHENLLYPFTALLFLHIYYTWLSRRPRKTDTG
jgi:hypothetical protein